MTDKPAREGPITDEAILDLAEQYSTVMGSTGASFSIAQIVAFARALLAEAEKQKRGDTNV